MLKRTVAASLFLLVSCGSDAASPPIEPPAQPAVTAGSGNGNVVLSWTDVANETHYRAEYRVPTDVSWILLAEVPANTT